MFGNVVRVLLKKGGARALQLLGITSSLVVNKIAKIKSCYIIYRELGSWVN